MACNKVKFNMLHILELTSAASAAAVAQSQGDINSKLRN